MSPEMKNEMPIKKGSKGTGTAAKKKTKVVRAASKTTAKYWEQVAFRLQKGEWESSNFFVRMKLHNQRKRVRLDATTREEAGREALAEYLKILTHGWPVEETSKMSVPENPKLSGVPTVGDWIAMAKKKAGVRAGSVDKYAESLRTIVSEILGMRRARKPEQRSLIDAYKISDLTKENLKGWLAARLAKSRELDVVREMRAKNTIRSLVANAKGLFTEHIFEALGYSEDDLSPLPFRGLKLPTKSQTRYSSRFDAVTLLKTAAKELGAAAPGANEEQAATRYEQWKILYLALVAGLRYNEIDRLRVRDISPDDGRISIRTHETFRPKTNASEGDVLVSPEAAATLGEMLKRTKGEWFIKDGTSNKNRSYRAGIHHDALVMWLRNYEERGTKPLADVPKPIHELRKEAGTLVNSQHGLNEAKNFLRHSSISTTASYYVGSKGDITTGLS